MGHVKFASITLLIVLVAFHSGSYGSPAKRVVLHEKARDVAPLSDSDWLVALIEQVLGLTVSELLKMIYLALNGFMTLIELAAAELEKVLIDLNPESRDVVEEVISVALKNAQDTIQPIIDQLDEVMPILEASGITTTIDIIVDLIEQILGITLYELLTSIMTALYTVSDIILNAILDLNQVTEDASEKAAEAVQKVIDDMLIEGMETHLTPTLDMLEKLFPSVLKTLQKF